MLSRINNQVWAWLNMAGSYFCTKELIHQNETICSCFTSFNSVPCPALYSHHRQHHVKTILVICLTDSSHCRGRNYFSYIVVCFFFFSTLLVVGYFLLQFNENYHDFRPECILSRIFTHSVMHISYIIFL